MIKNLVLIIKGMAYGVTHIAPGLGGGLVLIMMGVYEQFVEAIGNLISRDWKKHLLFLVPLGIGMVVGMLLAAKVISAVWERYPAATMFFFMGLVVGTIPAVLKLHTDMRLTVGRGIAFVVGLALVVVVGVVDPNGGSAEIQTPAGLIYNFIASFLGGGASVTPGMDGSYMLLLMRTYEPVLKAVEAVLHGDIQWGVLMTTGVGAVGGIVIISKLIDLAIKRAPGVTYFVILGIIVGSVYGLWPRVTANTSLVVQVLAFVIGAAIAVYMGMLEMRVTPVSETLQKATRAD